jgi:hypothetical protein
MEIIHETKNATPLVNWSAATCGTVPYRGIERQFARIMPL